MYHRIRDLREDHDMNQTAVAKMLGMSQTGYSKYETGENDIPTSILIRLALFYDTSVDYLLELTDQQKCYQRNTRRYNEYNAVVQEMNQTLQGISRGTGKKK